jgi:hypothetical protein
MFLYVRKSPSERHGRYMYGGHLRSQHCLDLITRLNSLYD